MSTASVATSGLTWEQFLELPDDPRYKHAELLDGELILVNPPSRRHQHVVGALHAHIWNWIRAGAGRGEVTMDPPVQITGRRGYLPDVAWFREESVRAAAEPYFTVPPDLAVEVFSPSTRAIDAVRKRADYAKVGVAELWLVDTVARLVFVLRPPSTPTEPREYVIVEEVEADGVLTSPLLPGLEIPLSGLLS